MTVNHNSSDDWLCAECTETEPGTFIWFLLNTYTNDMGYVTCRKYKLIHDWAEHTSSAKNNIIVRSSLFWNTHIRWKYNLDLHCVNLYNNYIIMLEPGSNTLGKTLFIINIRSAVS